MNIPLEYSVVIRCHNEEQHIGKLLSGILEQNLKPKEIILVDSGSTDATLAIASRFPVKIVHINRQDFSFGRSLNRGCQEVTWPFLILASAHVYPVYKNWTENLLKPFQEREVGLVYGKQRAAHGSRYSERRLLKQWFPDTSMDSQRHPFCNNANAAIRRDLWQEVPYDEKLTGLEDLDWAKKITQLGHKIIYQAKAPVIHVHNESYGQIFNRYYREALALKTIYPQERFRRREFLGLLTSNIFLDFWSAVKDGCLLKDWMDITMFRLMQFSGTYRGFKDGHIPLNSLKDRFYYPPKDSRDQLKSEVFKELEIDYSQHEKSH